MDTQIILWLIGQGLALGLAGFGTLLMTHRNLVAKIELGNADLHSRVNDVRDRYVRRDDLDAHLGNVRQSIDKMDQKLDRILERQNKT